MKLYFVGRCAGVLGLTILTSLSASAITVQEVGVNPEEVVAINCTLGNDLNVYAGINQLVVDGVPMNGFCIDPFHYSLSSSSGYSYVPLTSAPKGHAMDQPTAIKIEELWANYYAPGMSAENAAGLQIAIWELVGAGTFSLVNPAADYGAGTMLGSLGTFSGQPADLIALTGPGQDYVVPVPDSGTTVALLGLALCGLGAVRRRF